MGTFKNAIKRYLDKRAQEDAMFAEAYKRENKTIDGCVDYILCEVQKIAKKGMAAMTDDEVFGMAVHYYDEADVKADKKVRANVVITGEYAPAVPVAPAEDKVKKVSKAKPKVKKPKVEKKDPFEGRQLSLFGF